MRPGITTIHLGLVALLLLGAAPAHAGNHVVESGQTLTKIARRYACTVAELQRANDLDDTTIYAGQTLVVPACGKVKTKTARHQGKGGDAKLERSDDDMPDPADYDLVPASGHRKVRGTKGQSIGKPWSGKLRSASKLAGGKGYFIRRPERAYGTSHMVAHIGRAVKAVRKRFPRVHTLAIGDLSAKGGGDISMHHSHQSGRDVDVGFFFKKKPKGYPDKFVGFEEARLDMAATWALLYAFARTADHANGVSAIYLDYDLQGQLFEWAKDHAVPEDYLERIFQYPEGKRGTGLVRHEPNHHDHFHVRFQCASNDTGCE